MFDTAKIQNLLPGWGLDHFAGQVRMVSPDGRTKASLQRETLTFGKGRGSKTVTEWTCRVQGVPGFHGYGSSTPPHEELCGYAHRCWEAGLLKEKEAAEQAIKDREHFQAAAKDIWALFNR